MARSFVSLMNQIARDQAKRQREQERLERAKQKANERQKLISDKETKQQYLNSQMEEVEDNNKQIAEKLKELSGILEHTLHVNDAIAFSDLRIKDKFREFSLPTEFPKIPPTPNLNDFLNAVKKPSGLDKLIPGAEGRYQIALQDARKRFEEYKVKYEKYMMERGAKVKVLREDYEKEKQLFDQKVLNRDHEIDELESSYHSGDPYAVCT
jgi:restriction system protein